ncbi:SURF1 family protein [Amorphus sp. 3PC139-8]|uniref:SURF1 family protein n=1 Tax=Amorphus sp. 3PC139-8 TaxID=2735676 RepID=UPI00345D4B01
MASVLLGSLIGLAIVGFSALGVWQLQRRDWKLDLIARVDSRIHQPAAAAPGPADWPSISADDDEYRRVRVTGHFLNDRETLVQAVTDLGGGFWVVTPLVTDDGFTVLVNRGFVPPERRDPTTRTAGMASDTMTVEGLMRMTEPNGGFLRANAPAEDRWYSRDVAAIAEAKGLGDVAPYFIDADTTNPGSYPVGGLTRVTFRNTHLVYAMTWFALAAMALAAGVWFVREEMRRVPRGRA